MHIFAPKYEWEVYFLPLWQTVTPVPHTVTVRQLPAIKLKVVRHSNKNLETCCLECLPTSSLSGWLRYAQLNWKKNTQITINSNTGMTLNLDQREYSVQTKCCLILFHKEVRRYLAYTFPSGINQSSKILLKIDMFTMPSWTRVFVLSWHLPLLNPIGTFHNFWSSLAEKRRALNSSGTSHCKRIGRAVDVWFAIMGLSWRRYVQALVYIKNRAKCLMWFHWLVIVTCPRYVQLWNLVDVRTYFIKRGPLLTFSHPYLGIVFFLFLEMRRSQNNLERIFRDEIILFKLIPSSQIFSDLAVRQKHPFDKINYIFLGETFCPSRPKLLENITTP